MCTGCCEGIARSFLYISNLLVFLLACVILGLSIWIAVDSPSFVSIADSVGVGIEIYTTGCYILIAISGLVIIITFLGCCGAAKDSRCLLATYFAFVLLLLIGIGIGAYFIFTGNIETLKNPFIDGLKKYDRDDSSTGGRSLVKLYDDWQQQMECCGVDNWKDWSKYNSNYQPNNDYDDGRRPDYGANGVVPESCCDPNNSPSKCVNDPTTANGIYRTGCFQKMVDEIDKNSAIVGGVAIGIVVVMIINAIIAIYMSTCGHHSTRPKYRYGRTATSDPM